MAEKLADVDLSNPESFRRSMDNIIIPACMERLKSGAPVYLGVLENQRKDALREIRKYLKYKKIPNSIEEVLKVVERVSA